MFSHAFLKAFIQLFVTIDAVGLVPVFLAITAGLPDSQRRRLTFESVAAATLIALGFMFLGDALFRVLGIEVMDFEIAGGVLLLVLAVLDLLHPGKPAVDENRTAGIMPLAMPLIAGPATLTTTLVLARTDGYALVMLVLAVNFLFLLVVLLAANPIARVMGPKALAALSKLVMVLLATIAVNFIRVGIGQVVVNWKAAQ